MCINMKYISNGEFIYFLFNNFTGAMSCIKLVQCYMYCSCSKREDTNEAIKTPMQGAFLL